MKKWSQEEVGGVSCCDNNHMQPAGFDACQLTLWTPLCVSCGEFYFALSSLKIPPGFYWDREISKWDQYIPHPGSKWNLSKGALHPKKRNYSEREQRSFIRCANSWGLEFKISVQRRCASGHRSLWFWACLTRSKGRCWGHSMNVYIKGVDSIFVITMNT